MWNRPGRKTHSDRLVQDETQDAVRPRCPAEEAVNSNRKTSVQRMKRSTPSAERASSGRSYQLQPQDQCPTGEGPTSNFNRRTWTEDEGPGSTPSIRPELLGKDQRQTPQWQHSLVGDSKVYPCNRDHAPRVSMVGNLGKSLTTHPLLPHSEPDVVTSRQVV